MKSYKRKTISLAVVAAFAGLVGGASEALAGDFYGGVGVGDSSAALDNTSNATDASAIIQASGLSFSTEGHGFVNSTAGKRSDTAWRLLGGYQFNSNFAIEAQYTDFGKATANYVGRFDGAEGGSGEIKTEGFGIAAVGTLPLAQNFSLLAKAGIFDWRRELRVNLTMTPGETVTNVSGQNTRRGTDPYYGVGLKYDVTKNVGVRLEWEQFKISHDNIDLISATLLWQFR